METEERERERVHWDRVNSPQKDPETSCIRYIGERMAAV